VRNLITELRLVPIQAMKRACSKLGITMCYFAKPQVENIESLDGSGERISHHGVASSSATRSESSRDDFVATPEGCVMSTDSQHQQPECVRSVELRA